ncbi:MAG: hypothetical protein LBU89_01225 [Fibromonadaceae bacterium]|jgi:hypothetical protein|nr:hypothetical protein [Fibromonadaceae bacterium]
MKKFFYISAVLLLGACSDLSVSKEEALAGELPGDFDWEVYAELNNDVLQSQIIFDINAKIPANAGSARREECVKFLLNNDGESSAFAENLYLNYVGCPKKGWSPAGECEGVYAQVPAYNKNGQCAIGGCWSGGWDEPVSLNDDPGAEEFGLKDVLPGKVATYKAQPNNNDIQIRTMCKFVLPGAETLKEAEDYLEGFPYDNTLVKQHFFLVGRSEGRPYKYCEGTVGSLRDTTMALKLGGNNIMYDFGAHLFCFDKVTQGIYLLK